MGEERILLVRLSHLGDIVHALPVFHALRAHHPRARIAWAVEPEFAGVLAGIEGLERTIPFARQHGASAWPKLAAELAVFAPTWIVDAQANLKSAAVALCAPSARRTGLHRRDWREAAGARVLHDWPAPTPGDPPHAIDRMLQLARHACGGEVVARFDPGLSPKELESGERSLARALGGPPGSGDVLLALSSPGDVRGWPEERWSELARALAGADRRVLLISGPQEADVGHRLAREFHGEPRVRSWVEQRGLRELAAVLGAASRAGARYVGVDSGPLHLAAACGMSVIALEGPQSHLRTGPWPLPERAGGRARHAVVRSAQEPECAPCFARVCIHPRGPVCMADLAPERVIAALEALAR